MGPYFNIFAALKHLAHVFVSKRSLRQGLTRIISGGNPPHSLASLTFCPPGRGALLHYRGVEEGRVLRENEPSLQLSAQETVRTMRKRVLRETDPAASFLPDLELRGVRLMGGKSLSRSKWVSDVKDIETSTTFITILLYDSITDLRPPGNHWQGSGIQ